MSPPLPSSSGDRQPVPVPREVWDGVEAVRRSGLVNMFARHQVSEIAQALGFDQAAVWVRAHRDLYARAVFHGFSVRDDDGDDQRGGDRQTES